MAQNSRLVPILCLQWVLERPHDGGSRQSPDFRLFQKVWYLEIQLLESRNFGLKGGTIPCMITLHRRTSHSLSGNCGLKVECHLKVSGKSFYQSGYHPNGICGTSQLFHQDLKENEMRPFQKGIVQEWNVFCMFSETTGTKAGDCFSLRVGNKTTVVDNENDDEDDEASKNKKNFKQLSQVKKTKKNILSVNKENESVQASPDIPLDMDALSSDISSLLNENILPDFKLICGRRTFQVHRFILAALSEDFRDMLGDGTQESVSGSAYISDLEERDFETFLKFLYSGQLENLSEDSAASFYEIADRYDVGSLRKVCSHWMEQNLSEKNCIRYLTIANSHSDSNLRAGIVSFIVKHPGLFKNAEWLTFSERHPVVANEVFLAYFSSCQ